MTEAAELIRRALPDFRPRLAITLGSGLGGLLERVTETHDFTYADLPGFPAAGVSAHRGAVVAGRLRGVPIMLFAGRAHYYEHGDPRAMKAPIETAKALGAEALFLSNAAGSLREDLPPGALMAIADHINWSGLNPLIGEPGDARFVDMTTAYDSALRERLDRAARACDLALDRGVYMWFSGPSFETPAEIRMARTLGADAVGMSTVPETILARYMGLKVVAVSAITNYGAGMTGLPLSHDETKREGARLGDRFATLVETFVEDYA